MKYNSNLYNIPMCNGTVQDCSRKHLMASLSARHPSAMHLLYDFHIILTLKQFIWKLDGF